MNYTQHLRDRSKCTYFLLWQESDMSGRSVAPGGMNSLNHQARDPDGGPARRLLRRDPAAWVVVSGISVTMGAIVASIDPAVAFFIVLSGQFIGGLHLLLVDFAATRTEQRQQNEDLKAQVTRTLRQNHELRNEVSALRVELTTELAMINTQLWGDPTRGRAAWQPPGDVHGTPPSSPRRPVSAQARWVDDYVRRSRFDVERHRDEGYLRLEHPKDVRELLRLLTVSAEKEILAVDQIGIEAWLHKTLMRYLVRQLGRARSGLRLQRIRLFDPRELSDPHLRELLRVFLKMHQEAGADLVLCPLDDDWKARISDLAFVPRQEGLKTGCLLVDPDGEFRSLRGVVGPHGFIQFAEVDFDEHGMAQRCLEDYGELLSRIRRSGVHEDVVGVLEAGKSSGSSEAQ